MQMISIHKRLRAIAYAELLKWGRRKEIKISLNWALTWHKANLGKVQISYDASGFAQTVKVPLYGGRGLAKSSFRLQNAVWCVIWEGEGWLKTSEYRHLEGRGLKLLKKPSYDIWTFRTRNECSGNASDSWSEGLEFDTHLQLTFFLCTYMCRKLA